MPSLLEENHAIDLYDSDRSSEQGNAVWTGLIAQQE